MSVFEELLLGAPIVLSDEESDETHTCSVPCFEPLVRQLVQQASSPSKRRRVSEGGRLIRGAAPETTPPPSEASECGDFVFEDDSDCEDFIPKGALRGAAAAAAALQPDEFAARAVAGPKPPPGALRVLLPLGGLSAPREVAAADFLTEAQTKAVQLVAREARPKSQAAEEALDQRLQSWGYKPGQLAQVLAYIRDEAPIIIHIDLAARFEALSKDSHYRNQFETNCTRGSSDLDKRRSWESRLFPKSYEKAKPFDRVKYGVLNAVNDPRGIASVGNQYGKDYLVLRGARLRTTFSDKDSCNSGQIASCEWYAHVLQQYNDLELHAVTEVALGERLYADSAVLLTAAGGYKEVQIHGELQLANHVESVVVHPSRLGTPLEDNLRKWCETLDIQFQSMDGDTLGVHDGCSSNSDVIGEPFRSTPLWRWGLSLYAETWLRFDTFASVDLESTHQGKSVKLPSFAVGRTISVDTTAMVMTVAVDGEEVRLVLERSGPSGKISNAPPLTNAGSLSSKAAVKITPKEITKKVIWEWCASATGTGTWTAYSAESSTALETAFQRDAKEVNLMLGTSAYRIDLKKLKQINDRTKFVRTIRRR